MSRVLVCRDGSPARVVAPDPRRFALHAMSMVDCPEHDTQGRSADRRQDLLLLDAIVEAMPHYPLDEAFLAQMPDDLAAYLTGRHDMPPRSGTSAR